MLTGKKKPGRKKKKKQPFYMQFAYTLLFFFAAGFLLQSFAGNTDDTNINLSELTAMVNEGQVETIVVKGDKLEIGFNRCRWC